MGAEMDRLEVQVEAQATKANNQLDKLVSKLDRVSGALSNLNSSGLAGLSNGVAKFAQASSQLSNVKTADFTRLSKNIEKLSSLNTQQIFSAASSMKVLSTAINSLGNVSANSLQVAQIAKDISKLGNKNVQAAIANLPALAVAMNDFMTVMAKSPQVSRNIIQMTDALANLAAQGNKVGAVSNSLTRNVNKVGSAMDVNTKKTKGFASVIGSLYQKFFWVSRGIDKLWDSIESSMGYIENLNYFDAAFGQVADAAVVQWEEAGYSSADAYYESFSSRAKELTSKMTGFNINDDGTLTATGDASLGINPSKLMNYQAMFAQMSSSMGVASETSLKLSQALTEIGADLASVKNMDFDKVWTDMASGLAGMSRTLDKYGANIRNVNLQQKLFDLGINENITNLNQNDKALLRTIILLESTEYAWGDLADTLNMPANQIRLLESNISNLSRTLGNLFLPALSKVLPYVNGFVIAIERLLTWVGNLMGINLGEITQSIGSSAADIGELLEDTEGLSGSLDDASDAAKKLKANLQGFDELNVITTSDDSASSAGAGSGLPSGLLDDAFDYAFSKYQEAWDEAYANMENRAEEFADKIEETLAPITEPLERLFINLKYGGWTQAGENVSDIANGFYEMLINGLEMVDWKTVGHNIGLFLKGIEWLEVIKTGFELKFELAEAIADIWFESFQVAPIETSLLTALGTMKFTGLGTLLSSKLSKTIKGTKLMTGLSTAWKSVGGLGGILTMDLATIMGAGTLAEIGMTIGTGIIGGIAAAFVGFNFGKEIGKWLNPEGAEYYDNFKWFGEEGFFNTVFEDFGTSWDALADMITDTENPVVAALTSTLMGPLVTAAAYIDKWDIVEKIQGVAVDVRAKWNENVTPLFEKETWEEFGDNAKEGLNTKWNEFTRSWEESGLGKWFAEDVSPWLTKEKWLDLGGNIKGGISEKWIEFTEWWESTGFYAWWQEVETFFDKETWTWEGISTGLEQAFDNAFDGAKGTWNSFATWLNSKLNFSWEAVNILGEEIIPAGTINLGTIPTFSIGGFPEDGLFMANHHELVGRFSNGKTAVANNEQIISGIEQGVRDANAEQVALLREQNELLQAILEKETGIPARDIFDSVRQSANEYTKRTRQPAF